MSDSITPDPLAERIRIAANHRAIEQAECDKAEGGCGAQPPEKCRSPKGVITAVPHGVRRDRAVREGTWRPA